MDDLLESAKNITLLILSGLLCFGLSFGAFALRGDRKHNKKK